MFLRKWEDLPENMKNEAVRPYYDSLQSKKGSLFCKFLFDRVVSFLMLICLLPVFLILAYFIKKDSPGPIFFRQERVTQYGMHFYIYKFRTMKENAEKVGKQVTTQHDARITKIGSKLRGCRLDEIPQLINILKGEMSFVGTRPEVPKYVVAYTDEMLATLLLPAGVTSKASIEYKDEEKLLLNAKDADCVYIYNVLPQKMCWNFKGLIEFGFVNDLKIMIQTIKVVI